MSTDFLNSTAVLTGRTLKHVTRSPDTIITTAVMPIGIMLLFVFVLGGAITTGPPSGQDHYIDYAVPGVLLITVAMGISYTSYRLFIDLQEGIIDRFSSMPIARFAPVWAHVMTSVAATSVSVVAVIAAALLVGFRSGADVLAWIVVAGLLLLFTLALTWVAVVAGLLAKTIDGATALSYPLILLPFLSSAFVPTASMPAPVRWFAEHQPATSIVNSIRDLLTEQPVGDEIWVAVAWCVVIFVLGFVGTMGVYRWKSS
ncbi:ABC transporter permease [Gordonia sp. (in: high G+C Gram-positive bacteria)]|uniref:ABC transporter permease n=1 Tax=Gordonia sp. (in: high G+C Gram-positive bacteria) TaxID=84139 RepID=UPI003C710DAA